MNEEMTTIAISEDPLAPKPYAIGAAAVRAAAYEGQAPEGGLRMIPEGEAFAARQTINAETGIVEATFAVRAAEGEPRFEKHCTLDFSGVSKEKLIDLALYEIKQKVQGMLRKDWSGWPMEATHRTVDVQAEIVARERVPGGKPTIAKLAKSLGMTEEQAMEVLRLHSAREAGGKVHAAGPPPPKAARTKR